SQIEVERGLLEHHAERPERPGAPFGCRPPANFNAPGWGVEQSGNEREERRLAGAVRAKERSDPAGKYLKAHIVERLLRSVPVRDVVHAENCHRRRVIFWGFFLHKGGMSVSGRSGHHKL